MGRGRAMQRRPSQSLRDRKGWRALCLLCLRKGLQRKGLLAWARRHADRSGRELLDG